MIGTVTVANPGNPFQVIHVQPAARLDRLEDVIILLTPQELKKTESADASAAGAHRGRLESCKRNQDPCRGRHGVRLRQKRPASSGAQPATQAGRRAAGKSAARETEMSYMLNPGAQSESNIEVHKYYSGTVLLTAFLALVLQAFLHKYGRWSELLDLPLLVTIYFGVSRRNPVSGLFLGSGGRHPAGRAEPR